MRLTRSRIGRRKKTIESIKAGKSERERRKAHENAGKPAKQAAKPLIHSKAERPQRKTLANQKRGNSKEGKAIKGTMSRNKRKGIS